MGEGESHGSQTFGGRVHEHHRVLLPRLSGQLVPHTAPQVDHFLAVVIGAAGAAQFTPPSEILDERLAHRLKATADVPLNYRESRTPIAHRLVLYEMCRVKYVGTLRTIAATYLSIDLLYHLRLAMRRFGFADEVTTFPDAGEADLLARLKAGDGRGLTAEARCRRHRCRRCRSRRTTREHGSSRGDQRSLIADLVAEGDHPQLTGSSRPGFIPAMRPAMMACRVTGQALARVLLRAAADGVSVSFLNQAVEIPELRLKLRTLLGTGGSPQLVLRMGYGPETKPTPRRSVKDVLV